MDRQADPRKDVTANDVLHEAGMVVDMLDEFMSPRRSHAEHGCSADTPPEDDKADDTDLELASMTQQLKQFRPSDPVLQLHARRWQKKMQAVQTRLASVRREVDDLLAAGDFRAAAYFLESARSRSDCGDLELRTLDATSSRVAHGFWQDTQSKVKAMLAENAFPEVSPRVFRMKRTF